MIFQILRSGTEKRKGIFCNPYRFISCKTITWRWPKFILQMKFS